MVRHEGLRQALFRWLDRLPPDPPGPDAGRHILRLDAQRFAYVDVADTPLVATSLRWDGSGRRRAGAAGTHRRQRGAAGSRHPHGRRRRNTPRCQVRPNGVEARLATSAAATLADRIEARPDGPLLRLGGRTRMIRTR